MKLLITVFAFLFFSQINAYAQGGSHVDGYMKDTEVFESTSTILELKGNTALVSYDSEQSYNKLSFYKIELSDSDAIDFKQGKIGNLRTLVKYKSVFKSELSCEFWTKEVAENEPGITINKSCTKHQVNWGKGVKSHPYYFGKVKKDTGFISLTSYLTND